jgi:hypothetical protein
MAEKAKKEAKPKRIKNRKFVVLVGGKSRMNILCTLSAPYRVSVSIVDKNGDKRKVTHGKPEQFPSLEAAEARVKDIVKKSLAVGWKHRDKGPKNRVAIDSMIVSPK